jgi:hypothetical protein
MSVSGVGSSIGGGNGAGIIAKRGDAGFEVITRAVQRVRKRVHVSYKTCEVARQWREGRELRL